MKPRHVAAGLLLLLGCGILPPHARAFQQADTASVVSSADYQPPAFADADRLEKIEAALPEVQALFARHAEEHRYPGYVYGVVVGDSLFFHEAAGTLDLSGGQPVTATSKFHIASMTKSVVAMAVLKLRDAGALSLQDPVRTYVPELDSVTYLTRDAPPMTIENLLTMTSGLPEDNPWADRQLDDSTEELVSLLEEGLSFSTLPAYRFEYSNLGYALLGLVVSRASGVPYQQYVTDEVLEPLGMTDTYWEYAEVPEGELAQGYRWEENEWKEEPMLHTGAFGAIGGLITSMRDFSRYVAFHLAAYPPRNAPERGPVARASARAMHQANMPQLVADAEGAGGAPCPYLWGYGYGLVVRKDCEGVLEVAHSGGLPGFGSNYRLYPELGLGIISFANRTYAPTRTANDEAMGLILEQSGIEPRAWAASALLQERAEQVARLVQTWDPVLEEEILAENFYLDTPRALRRREAEDVLAAAGAITSIGPLAPANQLRGTFVMHGEKEDVEVFFSLSPESVPKVQALRLRIVEKNQNSAD